MSYSSGFSDRIQVTDGSTTKYVYTMGDYTYSGTRTEIAIKTKGSDTVRYMPGMAEYSVSFTVYAGTDPTDSNSFDAYNFFLTMFTGKTEKSMTIETETHTYICTGFERTVPIDDLKSATVTLKIAASDNPSTSST